MQRRRWRRHTEHHPLAHRSLPNLLSFLYPCSALVTLLQQLGALNRDLPPVPQPNPALTGQFHAACVAIEGCGELAGRLPLRHNDLFRLASTLALVFGAGPAFLQQFASNTAASTQRASLLIECGYQLAAASAALRQAADPYRQPESAAAFVRTAGRPDAVLPWLLAVSQALLAVPQELAGTGIQEMLKSFADPAKGKSAVPRCIGTLCRPRSLLPSLAFLPWLPALKDLNARALADFADMASSLLASFPDTYNTAMQQSPATQQAVLSVLLDRCLPLLAADNSLAE